MAPRESTATEPRKPGRPRKSLQELDQPREPSAPKRPGRKRKSQDAELDELEAQPSHYPVLKARVKHVPQAVITSKWATLSGSAQDQVRDLVASVERPVMTRYQSSKRREEAQIALAPVLKTLRRKLPRMAFPPLTRDTQFNVEALLDGTRALEAQLTSVTHAITLRKTEVEKEKQMLEWDKKRLATLERDAAKEEALRKRQTKKSHPLLRALSADALPSSSDLHVVDSVPIQALRDDETLQPLIHQLTHHLDSMKSNRDPIRGLGVSITRAQAAVDDVLYRRGLGLSVAEHHTSALIT